MSGELSTNSTVHYLSLFIPSAFVFSIGSAISFRPREAAAARSTAHGEIVSSMKLRGALAILEHQELRRVSLQHGIGKESCATRTMEKQR